MGELNEPSKDSAMASAVDSRPEGLEANFRHIVESIPVPVAVTTPTGEVETLNGPTLKYFGKTLEELKGWKSSEVVHPDDLQRTIAAQMEAHEKGVPYDVESRHLRFDGTYRWFNVHGLPLRDAQDQIVLWFHLLVDIDDRKKAEEMVRASEQQFRTIFDEAGTGITLVDLKMGEPIRNNRALQKMLGCSEDELGRFETYDRLTHPDNRKDDSATFRELCEGKRDSVNIEKHFVVEGGRSVWANVVFTLLRGDDGQPRYIIAIHEDITERKRTLERLQANQDLLDLAQKSAGAMAFDWYIQEEINHWSPEQEALFGLPPGTFDGTYKSWKSMMYAPDWPMVVEAIQHAHQTGIVEAEYRVVWPDGSLHWLSTNGRMFFDDAGEPLRMVGFTSDVSRRKMAEVQLAGEKHLLEMVATGRPLAEILASLCSYVEDIAPDCYCGVYLIDWDGPKVRLAVGPTLPAGFNTALDGIYFTPETGPCAMAAYERTQVIAADVETDELWRSSPFRTLALDYRLKSCWSTPIYSRSGEVLGTFAIYQNKAGTPTPLQQDLIAQVTHIASIAIERSQHEEALRRSEAFLAEGQYLARIGSFAWNAATDKITWSEQLYRMYEFEPGLPITPEVVRTRVHPDDVSLYEKMKEHQLIGGGDFEWQYRLLMPDKSIKHLHAIAHASRNHQGEPEYIAAVQDVTARRASEEALRLSEAELRRANQYLTIAQELSHTGSYARDVSTDEQTLSDEMYRIWDFDPSQKVTQDMVVARVHPEDRPLFEKGWQRALEEGEDIEAPAYRIVTGSGTVKHLRSFSRRVEEITDRLVYVGATQDVTEKKLAEEALDQARSELARVSRVTTFGALTASIAHEVNQPLSGIITNASTCQRMLAAEPPNIEGAIETARRIIRDGNRASDVITRLRSLFGKREVMAESVNLNDVVEEIITLSRRELEANQVLLKQDLSDDLPIVIGDRVQLQQVILNLLLNASHAMEDIEDRPRELVIGTRQEENGVLLTVKDIGVGFDPQNEDKLFNAFYTTKKSGMGIGLHVSRSIIESHRGRLWATLNDGPGATFSFTIPRAA